MRHINQRRYAYIPYPQWTELPNDPRGKKALCAAVAAVCAAPVWWWIS